MNINVIERNYITRFPRFKLLHMFIKHIPTINVLYIYVHRTQYLSRHIKPSVEQNAAVTQPRGDSLSFYIKRTKKKKKQRGNKQIKITLVRIYVPTTIYRCLISTKIIIFSQSTPFSCFRVIIGLRGMRGVIVTAEIACMVLIYACGWCARTAESPPLQISVRQ